MAIEVKLKRKSKTIQYNTAWGLIASAMLIAFSENQALIQEYIPSWAYLIVIVINSGVGVFLRTVTNGAVEPLRRKND